MRKVACLALGVALVAFESSLFSVLPLELTKPDIGAPFIIYGVFFLSPVDGFIAAVVFGFTQELLSAGPSGSVLFMNMALLLSCLFVRSRLYVESRYIFSLVCAASVLFEALVFLALSLIAKGETKDIFNVLLYSVPDAIATGFVSLFLFSIFEHFKLRYPSRV
jgi:cell shape-determining protein MreD